MIELVQLVRKNSRNALPVDIYFPSRNVGQIYGVSPRHKSRKEALLAERVVR